MHRSFQFIRCLQPRESCSRASRFPSARRSAHLEKAAAETATTRKEWPPPRACISRAKMLTRGVVEAFGKSLAEFVTGKSGEVVLLLKPTRRTAHTGGERIPKSSAEEAARDPGLALSRSFPPRSWRRLFDTGRTEAGGYGVAPKSCCAVSTHSQYNHTVRDLLKDTSNPASQFPPEDYVNGFKNQYEALSVSPILADAYSRSAERLAADAFRRGDSRGLIPCKPASEDDAACRTQFIQTFGRRAYRRPLEPEEVAWHAGDLQKRKDVSRRRAGRHRDHAAVAQLRFLARRHSQPEMEALCEGFRPLLFHLGYHARRRAAGERG